MNNGTKKIASFFDKLAPSWRVGYEIDNNRLEQIFECVDWSKYNTVLDVACGTGVLDEYLLSKGLKVDAIDVSAAMIEVAKRDPKHKGVNYYVADFYSFKGKYDAIVVFDSYPHFLDKVAFAKAASELLSDGGEVWIVFDECREKIDAHHLDMDPDLSCGLLEPEEEYSRVKDYFSLIYLKSNQDGYYLALKKK